MISKVEKNDKWPEAITDGLTLPCSICHNYTNIDYGVSDEFWRKVTHGMGSDVRLGVVCLDCLIRMSDEESVALENIQIVVGEMNIECVPKNIFIYKNKSKWRSE